MENEIPDDFPPPYDTKELLPNTTDTSPSIAPHRRKPRRSILATLLPLFTIILYVGVLVASMVALGYAADTNRDMSKISKDKHCILFIKAREDGFLFSGGHACDFVIYGNASLGFLAVLLIILAIIKAALGRWLTPALMFDYFLLILGALLSFAVGITISVGLSYTCNEFTDNDYSCRYSYVTKYGESDPKVYFYTRLHRSELTTWIIFGMLCFMLIIESVITAISCIVRKKKRNSAVLYEGLSDVADAAKS